MPSLGTTLARLMKQRRMAEAFAPESMPPVPDLLTDMQGFGSNPGALRACCHVPAGLAAGAPLVVVLHGCTQTAAAYAHGSGWTTLADAHGFALLFPEQQRANNLNLCFNWFASTDNRRDGGEALSISQMIAAMINRHGCDPRRVFITGLSAGGAMTSIMLAAYPELFKAGAIISGLPFGPSLSMGDAFARMRGEGHVSDRESSALVRAASDHAGPWPAVAVWHGTADSTVDPSNADRILAQWQGVHGLAGTAPEQSRVDGCRRRIWRNAGGMAVVEDWQIDAMGHGTPLDPAGGIGTAGPFMLDVGISSTGHIAARWGLAPVPAAKPRTTRPLPQTSGRDPAAIIAQALRAAGLKN